MNTLANSLGISLGTLKNWERKRSRPIRGFWPALRRLFRGHKGGCATHSVYTSAPLPQTCFQSQITIFFLCENDVFQSNEKTGDAKSYGDGSQGPSKSSGGDITSTICFIGGWRC